jgi:hypothetical protein
VVYVSVDELRKRFNEGGYLVKVQQGDLVSIRTRNSHVSKDALPHNCEWCTNSQEHIYKDPKTDREVAKVHQYKRQDGTIGASGMPDPKLLIEGEVQYHIRPTRPRGAPTPKKPFVLKMASKVKRKAKYYWRIWIQS